MRVRAGVQDHCSAIEHVFLRGEPGQIYNVGGGNERENITVAEQIVGLLGKTRGSHSIGAGSTGT